MQNHPDRTFCRKYSQNIFSFRFRRQLFVEIRGCKVLSDNHLNLLSLRLILKPYIKADATMKASAPGVWRNVPAGPAFGRAHIIRLSGI